MKPASRLAIAFLAPLAFAAVLAGCVVSEEDDYTVTLNADGKSGTVVVVRTNLQSDESEPAKQRSDFDQLMKTWKGDEYLLEQTKEGAYVKDRDLAVKGGELVWRETAIFADVARLLEADIVSDTLRFSLGKGERVVSTNGAVVRLADTTRVLWPVKAGPLRLRVHHDDFRPTSDFAAEFRRHSRK